MKLINYIKKIKIIRNVYFAFLSVFRYLRFLIDYSKFNSLLLKNNKASLSWKERYVCLDDKTSTTSFDSHYVYHTAWAARKILEISPSKHVDISSSIYFNAIASAFIPIDFYDYRPAKITLKSLNALSGNLLSLPFVDNEIQSLSCMHVIEHIGLGRYGDKLDIDGDLQAITELKRVLKEEGDLLIVVPVGKPTINFNAHRVYSYEQIVGMFSDLFLKEFTLLTDDDKGAEFIENASSTLVKEQKYACGCFWFKKTKEKYDHN